MKASTDGEVINRPALKGEREVVAYELITCKNECAQVFEAQNSLLGAFEDERCKTLFQFQEISKIGV
jgi:hypothetical protein